MEILVKRVLGSVKRFIAEGQRVKAERLRQEFLAGQRVFKDSGAEAILQEEVKWEDAFIWSTPVFTLKQPDFIGFVRFNIRRLIDPYLYNLRNDQPAQAFEQVLIVPNSIHNTLIIGEDIILEPEEWANSGILRRHLVAALNDPSRRLVRCRDFLLGHDAYDPFYEADEYLDGELPF